MLGYLAPLACLLAAGSLAFAQTPTSAPASQPASAPAAGAAPAAGGDLSPRIKLETSLGDIVLELNGEKAPISVDNFVTYVEAGFYDNLIFHRVVPTFMIQGGGYTADLTEKKDGLRPSIKNEWQNGLKNARGTIAMARTQAADSATAQFFINVVNNDMLDQPRDGAAYAVFGKVVEGMDTVDKIRDTETISDPKLPMGKVVPKTAVIIKKASLLGKYNRDAVKAQVKVAEAAAKSAAEGAEKAEKERGMSFQKMIETGMDENGKKIDKTESGLMYTILRPGDGPSPKPTDKVEVNYVGWLTNGKEFDSSYKRNQSITFPLNQVIKGWTEGVSMMKVGEKRRLIIPADLAYGATGRPGIPANSTLVFEVELIAIK